MMCPSYARRVSILALAALLCAGLPAPLRAQAATATLSGVVLDDSGAAVPGVGLSLVNDATRLSLNIASDERGRFTFAFLLPGTYVLTARRQGFMPVEWRQIALNVNDAVSLTVRLKVAAVGEDVSVVAETPRVSTSPAVATVIDRQFVENLPLNGRSFQSLLLLTPGIVLTPVSGNSPGQFSVNGQRANANYFTVDGVSANIAVQPGVQGNEASQFQSGALPAMTALGGTQGLVSLDALEQFKIQTSTYAAEFGRQPGGQVQLVTRSGTSTFRGSAFGSFRDEQFDANDWFANQRGLPKAEFYQHLFGGTVGGPLSLPRTGQARTFFFANYEGLRLLLPATRIGWVPSPRLREAVPPAVRPLLHAFPLPDQPELLDAEGLPTGFSPLTVNHSNPSRHDTVSARLDHTLNDRVKLFGRYSRTPSSSGRRTLSALEESTTSSQTLTVSATWQVTSRMTNDLRVNHSTAKGQSRATLTDFGGAIPVDISALATGYPGSGTASGDMTFYSSSGYSAGLLVNEEQASYQRQFNIVNTLSLAQGPHLFKMGLDYRRLAPTKAPGDFMQSNYFRDEAALVSGIPYVTVQSAGAVHPLFDSLSLYAQDTWKVGSRLTIDFGVRWELNPAPGERSGLIPFVVEGVTSAADVRNARLAPPGTPVYETVWSAFAPRVGAAWQLSRTPEREAVLRGGLGAYYDLGSSMGAAGYNAYPNWRIFELPGVPYPISPESVNLPAAPGLDYDWRQTDIQANHPHLQVPYTLQWNVALEQSWRHQTVTATYVGSAARRLLMTQLLNYAEDEGVPRPNPNFLNIFLTTNGPTSDYHALQFQYQRRLSRGLQLLTNYTWSHAIDEVSDDMGATLSRGNADFDIRHNFSAALTLDLPFPARRGRSIFGGWSMDVLVHARSGAPVNGVAGAIITPDGERTAVRLDLIPGVPLYLDDPGVPGGRRFNNAAFALPPRDPVTGNFTRSGDLGRNVLRLLPVHQMDVALQRQFTIGARWKLQLRAEAFNLLNHPNFGDADAQLSSNFGVPTSMLNRSLGGLNQLYQIGGPRSLQFSLKLAF